MNLLGTFIRTGSVMSMGRAVGFTHWCLEFEGTPEELQRIWDFICTLNKGSAGREPKRVDPVSSWTKMEFTFTDKAAAAMVKLAFA